MSDDSIPAWAQRFAADLAAALKVHVEERLVDVLTRNTPRSEIKALAFKPVELARLLDCGWDWRRCAKEMKRGGVRRLRGMYWRSDIKTEMPELWASIMAREEDRRTAREADANDAEEAA